MGPQLKQKILTLYPHWHQQPLRLSLNELDHPQQVFLHFFDTYSLPGIRACLQQWLEDALRSEGPGTADHFFTCQHIEKLVEAAWLMMQEEKKKEQPYENSEENYSDVEEEEAVYETTSSPTRHLPFFHSVQLCSSCQVVLEQGPREGVRLEGPVEIRELISTHVNEKQTLVISGSGGLSREAAKRVTVFITCKEIKLLALISTGSLKTAGAICQPSLQLVQQGAGQLTVQAQTGSLQVIIRGSGRVQAVGASAHTHLLLSGPGSFDGKQWQTGRASLYLTRGDARLTVRQHLEGIIGAEAKLYYGGHPSFTALQLAEGATVLHEEG